MIRRIPFAAAVKTMLTLAGCLIVFHVLVLIGIIPDGIVWGGRLEYAAQTRASELVSCAILLIVGVVVATRAGYITRGIPERGVVPLLWLLVAMFALNTVGNLLAETTVETVIFTPVTLISALLCWRIALGR